MIKHCFRLKDITTDEIIHLLKVAKECKAGLHQGALSNLVVANLFFEPSTRTQYSFNVAQERLGMKVISFNAEASSLKKGETFYDTVKTFESFGVDALVIRSNEDEYYHNLVDKIHVPIINAGDGIKDHPSQSLLDLMTIFEQFGYFSGLKIAIVGDVKHSRVAHTNIEVMERLGMECYISGPEVYRDQDYKYIEFEQALKTMDIIMLLRIQHERHKEVNQMSLDEYHQQYGLTSERVNQMKPTAIIMHPAPFNRQVEIANDVVECDKSRIFNQVSNGVYIRMALMLRALGENND